MLIVSESFLVFVLGFYIVVHRLRVVGIRLNTYHPNI